MADLDSISNIHNTSSVEHLDEIEVHLFLTHLVRNYSYCGNYPLQRHIYVRDCYYMLEDYSLSSLNFIIHLTITQLSLYLNSTKLVTQMSDTQLPFWCHFKRLLTIVISMSNSDALGYIVF